MDNWRFTQDALGHWGWQHTEPNGAERACVQRFTSRTDCIADAMRHGYLAFAERSEPDSAPENPPVPNDRSAESGKAP